MRRKKTNKLLLIILLILVIITVIVIILYNRKTNTDGDNNQVGESGQSGNNENVSYYQHFEGGKLDVDTDRYVELPENYFNYVIFEDTKEEIRTTIGIIIQNSKINIPSELLNGYDGDIYSDIKNGAKSKGKNIDEYVKEVYGYDNYEEYVKENKELFEEEIKKDLVYQALAKELNVTSNKADVEEYFAERLQNGDTYESLVELYGEKLMYKYTLQHKVERALVKQLLLK